MVYQWKDKSFIKANAQSAGEQMAHLEETSGLTPSRLLDANRAIGTPLHDEFEWNDSKAAEEYRKTQAQYIIRHISVTDVGNPAEPVQVRAFVSTIQDGEHRYLNISKALSDADLREQMLETAKSELLSFKSKYESLEELATVFSAIEKVTA